MNSDEIISMLHALQDVIDSERDLDDATPELAIETLRSSVKTLAVIQKDLLKSVLS